MVVKLGGVDWCVCLMMMIVLDVSSGVRVMRFVVIVVLLRLYGGLLKMRLKGLVVCCRNVCMEFLWICFVGVFVVLVIVVVLCCMIVVVCCLCLMRLVFVVLWFNVLRLRVLELV